MRIPWLVAAVSWALLSPSLAPAADCTAPPAGFHTARAITTPLGVLRIHLFNQPGEVPTTVANFLAYADSGDYDGSFFHRMIPDRILHGGAFTYNPVDRYDTVPQRPPIANEYGICNVPGTLAMFRPIGGVGPDTATSEWFINLVDNTLPFGGLNGITVFGQVFAEDMPVLAALAALHREFGTLLIDDPIAFRDLSDDTFANVPVLQPAARPPEGWGCLGAIGYDPILVAIPNIPLPIWLPSVEDNCGGDPTLEEQARTLLRADMGPKVAEQLVLITVPEPAEAWRVGAALSALMLVGATRRRRLRAAERGLHRFA